VTAIAVEWGSSTAVRQCGMLLAATGVRVVRPAVAQADPNGIPASHLDRNKEIGTVTQFDLVITDGTWHVPASELLAAGVDVVAVTPFGLTGPDAGHAGGDLIASHAGGYAYFLTWSVDDPATEPPRRGPQGQAQLAAGLTAAVAASARLAGRARAGAGHRAELVDVSEQEAVATLLLPELSERSEGTLKAGRRRARGGSKVAGGLVGLLACADGHVIISPREDHQWARLMSILGDPPWGSAAAAATAAARMANWEELQELLSAWSRTRAKDAVFRQLQAARIPCFPVNRVADALTLPQLRHRDFFYRAPQGDIGPSLPFRRSTMEEPR
jgi:crotonobetainyl-CoA:carnitine CoA-transferase CaiB-like acyl-CoA transferase